MLEHIADDGAALDEWREIIVPHGFLVLSVPAHADRYSISDEYVGHFRRYNRRQIRDLLENHGFAVVRDRSYGVGLGQGLDVLRNAVLRWRTSQPSTQEGTAMSGRLFQPGRALSAVVNYLVAAPFRLLQLPFGRTDIGVGYVVVAQRTS